MIKRSSIRAFDARYHRNGSDEGYCLCSFTWRDGNNWRPMRAVVYDDKIAVFSEDINERWRGSDFSSALRGALAAMEAAQPEKLYERVTP